jgi:transcriptional regulator with PAS, ATPase and Fis domain
MPDLTERKDDIPQLTNYFVDKYAGVCNRRVTGVSSEALQYLMQYDWPGNVRELENVIERAVVLGSSDLITTDDLPEVILSSAPVGVASEPKLYQLLREAKKKLISEALETNSDHNQAAAALGIHPNNLHRLIKSLDIHASRKRL